MRAPCVHLYHRLDLLLLGALRHVALDGRQNSCEYPLIWLAVRVVPSGGLDRFEEACARCHARSSQTVLLGKEDRTECHPFQLRARVNMCDTDPAALLRAQNTCVYVTSHLIHSQQRFKILARRNKEKLSMAPYSSADKWIDVLSRGGKRKTTCCSQSKFAMWITRSTQTRSKIILGNTKRCTELPGNRMQHCELEFQAYHSQEFNSRMNKDNILLLS